MRLDTDPIALELAMATLTGWTLDTHAQHCTPCLSKSWSLPSFEAAVARFNQIAQLAQAQDHHPEVLSSYTHLQIRIWTHDLAGLTHKDFALARAIDQLSSPAYVADAYAMEESTRDKEANIQR